MIIEISIENFLSVKEKIVFSLASSSSRKLPQNLMELSGKERLLKSAVVYGANASGKSNLIKAVFFMWNLVKTSHAFNVDAKIPRIPFKLDKDCLTRPSKFEIIFIHNGIKYKYGFACDNEKVIDEYLFHWPKGKEATIFNRSDSRTFTFTEDKPQQNLIKKQMNDNVLYLSRATQLGYEKTKAAYEFMVNNIVINYSPNWAGFTVRKIYENQDFGDKVIDILQKADFGGITDLKVDKQKRKVVGAEFKIERGNATVNPMKQKEEDSYDIRFIHETGKGESVEFSINEESAGTRKTLSMLGPIFEILETGRVAFIDELESSLHPSITRFLVMLFNSKYNKKNGQLIFTTHDTTLLSNELFRRDQIYICSKDPNKHTVLNSFLDYDLRESTDFERAYLNGRVGGLPFIDETLFD